MIKLYSKTIAIPLKLILEESVFPDDWEKNESSSNSQKTLKIWLKTIDLLPSFSKVFLKDLYLTLCSIVLCKTNYWT